MSALGFAEDMHFADEYVGDVEHDKGNEVDVIDEGEDLVPEDEVEGDAEVAHDEGGEEVFDPVEERWMFFVKVINNWFLSFF